MKKLSKSILTIGLTTSIITEGFILSSSHKVSADTTASLTQLQQQTPLKLIKASQATNTDIQLATSAKKTTSNFNDSLQNSLNKEA